MNSLLVTRTGRAPRFAQLLAFAIFSALCSLGATIQSTVAQPPNILFIVIDDLRPQLGSYGQSRMVTPRLDRFASESRRFDRHYVQVPTCGASRCALLTGRYPTRPGAYDNDAFATVPRNEAAVSSSLPRHFREQGYHTASIGKITHRPDGLRDDETREPELAFAWDEVGMPTGRWETAWDAFFAYADGSTRIPGKSPATERGEVDDHGYPDALIADAAIEKLQQLSAQREQPFLLAVGFIKPHLPFNAPAKYWDIYDEAEIDLAANPTPPLRVNPKISLHKSGELTPRYTGLKTVGVVNDDEARRLRHGYYACVSYVDAQVGRVLDELDRLGLRDDTIVVVWGDHGWHLGEQGVWGKHTLHDVALRSPLIVRIPHMAEPGKPAAGIVESVDIYPTLAELCQLPKPPTVDGESFAKLLADPAHAGKARALGFWAGGRAHTICTPRYRLTQWTVPGDRSQVAQMELYDHGQDPAETANIAEHHPQLVEEFSTALRQEVPILRP